MSAGAVPEVDVFLVALDLPAERFAALTASLSPAEQAAAARLERPVDRERWQASRGWLRRVLADELDDDPARLAFITDTAGKPRLAGGTLHFSLARSVGRALIATSRDGALGVDLETVRPIAEQSAVARRSFTANERRALEAVPPELRERAFLECWTRKEAYGKAIGVGLGYVARSVEVWGGDERPIRRSDWEIRQLDVGPGLVAALASGVPDAN